MTVDGRIERNLPDILADLAVGPTPDYLHDVLATTARNRQRPAWTFVERWLPMTALTRSTPLSAMPWRPIGVVLLLILALAAGAVLIGSRPQRLPPPFGPAANGTLAFSVGGDIYVRDTATGTSRLIVGGPGIDLSPAWSPPGTGVAFLRETGSTVDLFVTSVDGSSVVRIGGPYSELTRMEWSPDAAVLAVAHLEAGMPRISIVRADGGGETDLDVGMPADTPAWRPADGRQLAFRAEKDGTWGLFLANADGTGVVQLNINRDLLENPYEALAPNWSPDGSRIVFHRLVLTPGEGNGNGFRIDVADVNPAGVVTSSRTLALVPGSDDEFDARWTPMGDQVVFVRFDGGATSLWIAAPTPGAAARDLGVGFTGDFGQLGYTIAPDGRQLVAHRFDDGTDWLIDPMTGTAVPVDLGSDDGVSYQRR